MAVDEEPTLTQCPLCTTGLAPTKKVEKYFAQKATADVWKEKAETAIAERKRGQWDSAMGRFASWWSEWGFATFLISAMSTVIIVMVVQVRSCNVETAEIEAAIPPVDCSVKTGAAVCDCLRQEAANLAIRGRCRYDKENETSCDTLKEAASKCEARLGVGTGSKP